MRKYVIIANKNGTPVGYIKSISYTRGSFKLTQMRSDARKFSENAVHGEIDKLTAFGFEDGYVFMYD